VDEAFPGVGVLIDSHTLEHLLHVVGSRNLHLPVTFLLVSRQFPVDLHLILPLLLALPEPCKHGR
jgi:hypothetical protein